MMHGHKSLKFVLPIPRTAVGLHSAALFTVLYLRWVFNLVLLYVQAQFTWYGTTDYTKQCFVPRNNRNYITKDR